MGLFRKDIFSSEEKRGELLASFESELKKLTEEYLFALEFFEEYRTVQGFEEMMEELKVEYATALVYLNDEVQKNIQMLRERVDRINRNTRWMNSKQSADNMEGLNRTVGKLIAFSEEIEKSKGLIDNEKTEKVSSVKTAEQPVGPQ